MSESGLNLQFVFNLQDLPPETTAALEQSSGEITLYRQLILIAHGGKTLWQALQHADVNSENPVDDFSTQLVQSWFDQSYAQVPYKIIYPGSRLLNLQEFGKLAGWHQTSPFMLGINAQFGTWFAYRAVVLAQTEFTPSTPEIGVSPCHSCVSQACIKACPAQAVEADVYRLQTCISYRLSPQSACENWCHARWACPVAESQRYTDEQMRYHYGKSLQVIKQWNRQKTP